MTEWDSVLIVKIADRLRSVFSRYLATLTIDPKQYGILFWLAHEGPLSQVELGQQMGIDRAPMVQLIDHLEQREWVRRTPSPHDRRAHAVLLTDEGYKIFQQATELAHEAEMEVFAPLSVEERRELNILLHRLVSFRFDGERDQ